MERKGMRFLLMEFLLDMLGGAAIGLMIVALLLWFANTYATGSPEEQLRLRLLLLRLRPQLLSLGGGIGIILWPITSVMSQIIPRGRVILSVVAGMVLELLIIFFCPSILPMNPLMILAVFFIPVLIALFQIYHQEVCKRIC